MRLIAIRTLIFGLLLLPVLHVKGQTAADYALWGNTKFDLGDYKAAIVYYNNSIALYPFNGGIFFNRAVAKYNLMQYETAIEDFDRVIDLNPSDIKAYILRGFCKYYLNDKAGACADWDHAGSNRCYEACDLIQEYCH